jgi:NADPH-dependent glutamate synthase beta subunit-like oxidoreductase/glutamate synthase domain-containing protein 3/NAD-dependent dihydropyrimidine dehydrogenase PreA subunit
MINHKNYFEIWGKKEGRRLDTRVLEEMIQKAVESGYRNLKIQAYGQHGIGGRLWRTGHDPVHVCINGYPGQRVGSMGYPNTFIDVKGSASDDVGWLNAGAEILVRGNASNGVANAMAQGKIFVKGNIGSRGMTMTKHNPRFEPPELWVLGSVGDYFGEFMAGGIAVICGLNPQSPDNVLGYRPLVGMVGGKVFFRGPHKGYSQSDAKLEPIKDEDWKWLQASLKIFLGQIEKEDLVEKLSKRNEWQLLIARMPHERILQPKRSMQAFHSQIWDKGLGQGGMVGDLTDLDRSVIPVITRGHLRRFVPVWENRKFLAPCEATCPTGIPVQERWRLVREGRIDEAVDLALAYTPFPATVCGYLCPNPCMQACTKQAASLAPVDVTQLGKASIKAKEPKLPPFSGRKVAIIGGGPAGLSIAWQLRNMGHKAVIYDSSKKLGGKIASVIPHSRIPKDIFDTEMTRIEKVVEHVYLKQKLTREEITQLTVDYDFVIIAIGANKPKTLPLPGGERGITALEFLGKARADKIKVGKHVVIIGAGNVGCDVATEAHRLGADKVMLLDVQEPASFGKEREDAEAIGAEFRWPVFTKEITDQGVVLDDGEVIPADDVFISIGDAPDLDFLPEDVALKHGFVVVDENYQTTNPKIFAVGDVVRPGLLTDAIGAGRKTALTIGDILTGKRPGVSAKTMIDIKRISLEYFDPRLVEYENLDHCGAQCSSCGACRDCGICVAMCPESAISRIENNSDNYEYQVNEERCIACGFCAGVCPCGIWDLKPNTPLE